MGGCEASSLGLQERCPGCQHQTRPPKGAAAVFTCRLHRSPGLQDTHMASGAARGRRPPLQPCNCPSAPTWRMVERWPVVWRAPRLHDIACREYPPNTHTHTHTQTQRAAGVEGWSIPHSNLQNMYMYRNKYISEYIMCVYTNTCTQMIQIQDRYAKM